MDNQKIMSNIENSIYMLANLNESIKEADNDTYTALRKEIEVTIDMVLSHLTEAKK
ncbi:hypothetical protein ACMGE6_10620 [Macrococcus equi]|uniref:hypothetical protein n=1 Tax=Macrococcus equi TaxID=3395462 RepID=UPI0039BDA5D5